jgi:hypothetical protein
MEESVDRQSAGAHIASPLSIFQTLIGHLDIPFCQLRLPKSETIRNQIQGNGFALVSLAKME